MLRRNPIIAGILSFLVPGLGQIYSGESNKGAAIIVAAIMIGSLNIIVLPLIALANPNSPTSQPISETIWTYWIPRVVHDVISIWSLFFWGWTIIDAISIARKNE